MGAHDKKLLTTKQKHAIKFALGTGTVAGALALTTLTASADTYTVKPGDTLTGIASKYNTTIPALVALNHIENVDYIRVNQTIEIAQQTKTDTPQPQQSNTPQTENTTATPAVIYTVKAGDTLSLIASQQGVTVAEIIKNSALTNANLIYVGQKLTIKPEVKAKAKPIPREIPAVTHTVQTGESLWQYQQKSIYC